MADNTKKSFFGKLVIALQFAIVGINSALASIRAFAPNETKLIEVLQYIANVLTSIVMNAPLPDVPAALQRSRDAKPVALHSMTGLKEEADEIESHNVDALSELLIPNAEPSEVARTK